MSTKTIFITGGSRGIGEAIARLAAGKYNVAFSYLHSKDKAEAVWRELDAMHGGVMAVQCDVSDPSSVKSAYAAIKKRFGKVDILINNAGVASSELFIDTTPQSRRNLFAVNVDGAFNVSAEVLPDMLARKDGAIINVASVWGIEGASMEVVYSASKAAIIGFTRALAKEVAAMGVRVNAVAPGAIDTDMTRCYKGDDMRQILESIPLGRLGGADEVASAALFLAENAYITGAVLSVDGLLR